MKPALVLAAFSFLALVFTGCNSTQTGNGKAASGVAAGATTGGISQQQAQQYYGPAN